MEIEKENTLNETTNYIYIIIYIRSKAYTMIIIDEKHFNDGNEKK